MAEAEEEETSGLNLEQLVILGGAGPLQAELSKLRPGLAYCVCVNACTLDEEGPMCTPRLVSTLPAEVKWVRIELQGAHDSPSLWLEWSGLREGPKWFATLSAEAAFQKVKGFCSAKSIDTVESHCRFASLS